MRFLQAIRDMAAAFRADREREAGDGWENVSPREPLDDPAWSDAGDYDHGPFDR